MAEISGGCLCGKVRYTTSAQPMFQGVCHCTDCQRQGGTAFSVIVAFAEPDLKITGDLRTFHSKSDSGGDVRRMFCPNCGSPIYSQPATSPGMAFIKGGTLDDTSILAPKVHIFCDSRQNWVSIPNDAMCFAKSPN